MLSMRLFKNYIGGKEKNCGWMIREYDLGSLGRLGSLVISSEYYRYR